MTKKRKPIDFGFGKEKKKKKKSMFARFADHMNLRRGTKKTSGQRHKEDAWLKKK